MRRNQQWQEMTDVGSRFDLVDHQFWHQKPYKGLCDPNNNSDRTADYSKLVYTPVFPKSV